MKNIEEPRMPTLPYIYRASVVKVESAGRVRIRVLGLHDGIPANACPLAEPALDIFGAGDGTGMASVPGVGSDVYVFFDGGEINSPVYFAKATTKGEFVTLATDNQAKLIVPEGTSITIEADGATIQLVGGNILINGNTVLIN